MSTLNEKPEIESEQNQTALILERVESLLALHSEHANITNSLAFETQDFNIEDRFNALEERLTTVADSMEQQKAILEENANATLEESLTRVTEQLDGKTEALVDSFNLQIEKMFESLGNRVAAISDGIARQEGNLDEQETETKPEDTVSQWESQKSETLAKYGIEPDDQTSVDSENESPTDQSPTGQSIAEQNETEAPDEKLGNISEADSEMIEQLKLELNAKLRDAEIEISINRAKLEQQAAELEAKKVELERRVLAFEKKYDSLNNNTPRSKPGFMDRLSRHLRDRESGSPE